MGDFLSPKRRKDCDRLRRRLEQLTRHHNGCCQRYEYGQKAIYEQERQTALLLRQKWLDSKAKKTSKGKAKSDSSHPDHRNQIITKRLKHKIDGNLDTQNQTQTQGHSENSYRFPEDDEPAAKKPTPSNSSTNIDGQLSSVSVHIVHQINSGSTQQESKISTNVTVNSTIKSQDSKEAEVKTNVECKQEPFDDSASKGSNQSNVSQDDNADLESDIADILSSFDNVDDIPQDIIAELDKFDKIYKSVQDSETNDSGLNSSSDKGSMFSPGMYVDAAQTHGQVRSPPMQPYRTAPTGQPHVPVSSMSEGGPAAETLKQMAAQHQQHHPGQEQFGVKSAIDPFSDIPDTSQYSQRNGYPAKYQYSGQRPGSGGAFNGQQCLGYPNKPSVPPYGVSKPLTHYSHTLSDSGPSSLQQLQNQVAHFNQGPQMEITQTQHMQLSDGSHRMQLSQTQQIHLRQPVHNISLTQQQGFSSSPSMGPTPPNFMTNDQLAMHQQMMQSKLQGDQRQQATSAHMQQYMNRPPPEYEMQHANGISGAMTGNSIGTNPLQTIQNMVNQTNTHTNQGYSNVKSESNDLHMQNGIRTAHMSAMQQQQQMSNSVNPSVGISMAQAQMQYSNVQRQASYPGAMAHAQARGQGPNTPTYTSALMRNQRPPNVDIGPQGLNISQPRAHDWPGPRTMMQASGPPTSTGMLSYRSYSTDSAVEMRLQQQQQTSVQMSAMQSQAAMMQGNAQAQQQMMMQQQRLQMSHQMAGRSHTTQSPSYSMTTPPSSSFPQASASQDDILNLLDSAPNQSTDFFDVQTSVGGTEANWYDIDDILGNPK